MFHPHKRTKQIAVDLLLCKTFDFGFLSKRVNSIIIYIRKEETIEINKFDIWKGQNLRAYMLVEDGKAKKTFRVIKAPLLSYRVT